MNIHQIYESLTPPVLRIWHRERVQYNAYLQDICAIEKKGDFQREISYIKRTHHFEVFPYEWAEKYRKHFAKVYRDEKNNCRYVRYFDKRIYFPLSMSKSAIQLYFNSILTEQDEHSAHFYFPYQSDLVKGKAFIDIGSAEGIAGIHAVDQAEKVILFEPDSTWISCLEETFRKWHDKVEINNKFVSDSNDMHTVTMDSVCKDISIPIVIKADVEGMEEKVLEGAREVLSRPDTELFICLYHHSGDEEKIIPVLKNNGFQYKINDGYILFPSEEGVEFRHGVVHAWK